MATPQVDELDRFFFATRDGSGVYDALPNGVRITFELSGPGGGTWSVCRDGYGDVEVFRDRVRRPDCCLKCSVDDFIELIRGDLNVRQAFLDDRIAVKGDVGLIWRLQKLLVARQGA